MYSAAIAQAITDYLDTNEGTYKFDSDRGVFNLLVPISGHIPHIDMHIGVLEHSFYTKSIVPVRADVKKEEQMNDMAQFICRANYGLKSGNFEFDMNDGEISYRTYENLLDMTVSDKVITAMILTPVFMFERYLPGIIGVLYGALDPEKAVNICESN